MSNWNWTAILVAIIICLLVYIKHAFGYWKRQGIKTMPLKIPFGSMTDAVKGRKNFGEAFKDIYDRFKAQGEKYAGDYIFLSPVLVPTHHESIKTIMQTDFVHFGDRGFYVDEKADPLSGHLFSLGLAKWRPLRTKLTPTFTSGKMKMMFRTVTKCAEGIKSVVDRHLQDDIPIDIKDIFSRFNTDVIGSCAFGIECNSLQNPNIEFLTYGNKTFEPSPRGLVPLAFPHSLLRKFGFRLNGRDVENFFCNVVRETVSYREKNNVCRNDFMHLLIQLKNAGYLTEDEKTRTAGEIKEKLTMNELTAQCFVFYAAGFETSSTASTFATYELAINQDIQDKVREEINRVLEKYDGEVTYEAIMEMAYLDKVVCETLRKYPPVSILNRVCTKEYTVPNTSAVIKKNTTVVIPVLGVHYDPEFYPEPNEFRPERFTEENKKTRPPFTWIPFGDGPRICIGLRFGMLQVKIGLITLLREYKITLNSKTQIPLQFEPLAFITTAKGGIWLNMEEIKK